MELSTGVYVDHQKEDKQKQNEGYYYAVEYVCQFKFWCFQFLSLESIYVVQC